jgi:hypothetical protein
VRSEKLVAEARGQFGKPRRSGTTAVGSRYQVTASVDREDFTCAAVTVIF